MIQLKKTILTLALLLTAASGAWADIAIGDVYKFGSQIDFGSTSVWRLTVSGVSGDGKGTISGAFTLGYGGYNNGEHQLNFPTGTGSMFLYIADDNSAEPWGIQVSGGDGSYENPYTFSAIYEAPLIYHSLSDDKWIVTMPASNVTVEPEYYAQAMFATEGNEALTPTAAEDAIAGTDAPLIVEGTVAKAGQTDDAQGQVMYAVTTTADAAPALTAFSATVPTAEDYDDATTVFVWYYIQGADAPTGTVPSDDNTFSDSDISGTPLQVNVLSNKFDITFNAANDNTLEQGMATVSVDATAASLTDGKLSVKAGQTVTMTAATGYKFTDVKRIVANNWVNYGYTGSNTFFGTSNSSSRFTWTLMYTPSMLTGNYLKTVQAASRNTNPVTLKVYSGGDTPESGELIATQVYESPQANWFYDIELEQPVKFDRTKNLWIELSQVSEYAAYCGRQPTDSNGKIWYRVDDGTWNSNENYTPVIYIQVLSTIPATLADDGKTASFDMPASDITMDYELVRDMSVQMTAQVGDGEDGYRLRIKKNAQDVFEPADMEFEDMLALFTVTDEIEQKSLTFFGQTVDCDLSVYAVDENDQPTGDAIAFADLVPGRYVVMATAATGSEYDGQTAPSNIFELYQGYEVEVPAGEFVTYYKDEALTVEDNEAQLYTITAVSETTATATPFDVIPANVPLLLKNNSSQTRTILLIPTEDPLAFMHYSGFVGSLDPTTIAASTDTQTNYACNGKAFVYVKDAISAGANKAWLEIPASANGARQLKIVFADATGISAVSGLPADNGDWYDLNGRKIAKPTKKGVYIKDGKKVVVK